MDLKFILEHGIGTWAEYHYSKIMLEAPNSRPKIEAPLALLVNGRVWTVGQESQMYLSFNGIYECLLKRTKYSKKSDGWFDIGLVRVSKRGNDVCFRMEINQREKHFDNLQMADKVLRKLVDGVKAGDLKENEECFYQDLTSVRQKHEGPGDFVVLSNINGLHVLPATQVVKWTLQPKGT